VNRNLCDQGFVEPPVRTLPVPSRLSPMAIDSIVLGYLRQERGAGRTFDVGCFVLHMHSQTSVRQGPAERSGPRDAVDSSSRRARYSCVYPPPKTPLPCPSRPGRARNEPRGVPEANTGLWCQTARLRTRASLTGQLTAGVASRTVTHLIRVDTASNGESVRRYGLKEAADRVGVAAITLKRWLLAGRVPDVARDRNGWRTFSEEDVRKISAFARATREADVACEASEPRPRVASLFSGIGGFDLGFENAGFDVSFQCEINAYCRSVLARHWPNTPRAENIKELSGATIPNSDVWVGGFPCQDVSLARMGKRDGLRGRQSGLFYEYARLVGESRPRILVIENVHGLLNSHGGRDFGLVVSKLAELGYSVGWRTFNSQYFGVPQSRRRVYIVACYRDGRGPGHILFEPERREGDAPKGGSDGKKPLSPFKRIIGDPRKGGPVTQSIAYCLYACSARHTGTDWSRTYISYPKLGKVRRLTPRECEGVMAFPKDWSLPGADWTGNADDLDSARYHALGNAVTPPTAQWLAHRIGQYLSAVASAPPQEAVAG
jgi:DNA (cytosine-5)-methyltransferase 1